MDHMVRWATLVLLIPCMTCGLSTNGPPTLGGDAAAGSPAQAGGASVGTGGGGTGGTKPSAGGTSAGSAGTTPVGGGATSRGGTAGVEDLCAQDADGDSVPDSNEGYYTSMPMYSFDSDSDGTPDYLDADSDGNGIPDTTEAGTHAYCTGGVDTDGDGLADVRDDDNDNDGVSDTAELSRGLDPQQARTPGHTCDDLDLFAFGECSSSNVVIKAVCYATTAGTLSLKTLSGQPERVTAPTLSLVDAAGMMTGSVRALEVSPPSAGMLDGDGLAWVDAGATVKVEVSFSGAFAQARATVFLLDGATSAVLATGQVLWISEGGCAIPK